MAEDDLTQIGSRAVMAGHSRLKNGVASARLCPAIHVWLRGNKDVDARDKRGHDTEKAVELYLFGSTAGSTVCEAPALRTWMVAISSL